MTTQEMLEEAILYFGADDLITKMLSQKRKKEIEAEQNECSESYKEVMK